MPSLVDCGNEEKIIMISEKKNRFPTKRWVCGKEVGGGGGC